MVSLTGICLKKLRKSIKTERRGMLTRGGLTPAGQFPSSQLVCCLERSLGLRLWILPRPPYSPDLAPSDFHTSNHVITCKGKAIFKQREPRFGSQSMASCTTCRGLCNCNKTMGEVYHPCRSLCRERWIVVQRYVSLRPLEVTLGKSFMNFPCMIFERYLHHFLVYILK